MEHLHLHLSEETKKNSFIDRWLNAEGNRAEQGKQDLGKCNNGRAQIAASMNSERMLKWEK